ncbi:MAG: hypothetical protein KF799_10545 [Bdellovibrionales bacterium]|nr:hypothetical protein [Bdellovibrionales bacterium]
MLDTQKVFANMNTDWTVPADLPYFAGHFPGNPVFPAVGIVDASLELIRKQTGNTGLFLAGVVSAKFMQPIGPQARVHIDVSDVGGGEWECEWSEAANHERKIASLRLKVGMV